MSDQSKQDHAMSKSRSNEVLYVIAGDYQQALFFAKERGLTKDHLRYVNNDRDLHGIDGKGKTLYYYGTAYRQERCHEILNVARERGFNIEHV